MNGNTARFVRLFGSLTGIVTLGWVLVGQAARPSRQGSPLPTDWSHRHLIFSMPGTTAQANRVNQDPRYSQQLHRHEQRSLTFAMGTPRPDSLRVDAIGQTPAKRRKLHRDWSIDLGTGGKVGAGNFPAKFSFSSTSAQCGTAPQPDYVVYSTGLLGIASQASVVAFDNVYSGCGGTVPSVYWAYNTSGQILTSPVLSLDGSQIAFVQTDGLKHGTLVLLKWTPSTSETIGSPGTPTLVSLANYRSCPAPCMTTIDLRTRSSVQTDDKTSSVFYDYTPDVAWVGDSLGILHKFTGIFKGTPAEVNNATWPLPVNAGSPITGPVHDHVSDQIFLGDAGGFVYRVSATTGAITASGQLDFGTGIVASPIVDSTNGTVYVSASSDGTNNCGPTLACAAVYQLTSSFAALSTGNKVVVGKSTDPSLLPDPNPMFDGLFDSTYENSPGGTGNFYVCGNTGAEPQLFQVPIQAGVFGTPVVVSTLTQPGFTPPCSPVTTFFNPSDSNGPTERVFASAQDNGWPKVCFSQPVGGCLLNFVITQWKPSTAYNKGQEILVFSAGNPSVLFIQTATQSGTSGSTPPAWGFVPDITTFEGTMAWLNQGATSNTPFAVWQPGVTPPFVGDRILDSNGNLELVHTPGTTGATEPTWGTNAGDITADGGTGLTWRNAGPVHTSSLPTAGGTSGIIIDNAVGSVTLPGASQVYFSTLKDQICGTSGTGGCAVQASQSLK